VFFFGVLSYINSKSFTGVIGTGEEAGERQFAYYIAHNLRQGLFLGTATALQNGGKQFPAPSCILDI
jgi:hypothetical protein